MGVTYAARAFDIDESEVRTAVELVREKAERKRDETG